MSLPGALQLLLIKAVKSADPAEYRVYFYTPRIYFYVQGN